jgi:hypothetical protein
MIHCYGNDSIQYRNIQELVRKELPQSITSWNDDPDRTFEEIMALVKKLGI